MTLLTVEEVAALLRTTPHALHQMRHKRKGPPAVRVGNRLLFDAAKVETWLREREEEER